MNITIQTYVILIKKGKLTLDDVPVELRDKVQEKLGVA